VAVLVYLAEKTHRYLPADPRGRAKVFEWLGIISSDLGPAFSGQFVFNILAKEKLPWAIDYYNNLCTRLLGPLELQLGRGRFLAGDVYTIADMLAYPVAATSMKRFPGSRALGRRCRCTSGRAARHAGTKSGLILIAGEGLAPQVACGPNSQ
jgi:glutathione S-transferase